MFGYNLGQLLWTSMAEETTHSHMADQTQQAPFTLLAYFSRPSCFQDALESSVEDILDGEKHAAGELEAGEDVLKDPLANAVKASEIVGERDEW